MASISSTTQTAFDVPSLVADLMAVERRPIDTLNTKITQTESKISSLGTVSSLVSTFQTAAAGFNTALVKLTATPSDASFSATAASSGVPGTYSLSISQLAQAHNLVAAGQASSSVAIGDGTPTTLTFDFGTISGGTLTSGVYSGASFTSNGSGTASVVIDSTNNTLEGIRDAINDANIGVMATLVNDGSGTPWRLALTSTQSGAANSMKISVSGGDGSLDALLGYDPAGTQNLTQTQAAQNASLMVNGIPITSDSNTVSEAIQGVTLTLKNTTSAPATLTVARDTAAIESAAAAFVEAYNAMATQIKSLVAYDTDSTQAGALAGDSALRTIQDNLRSILATPATGGTLTRLAEVGLALQKDGTLKLDSSTLNAAIANDFNDVQNLFSSSSGFATRFESWAGDTLEVGGLIDLRKQSLNNYIDDRSEEIERLELRMEALEKKYIKEYTNLNLLLSRLNNASTFLSQQLAFSQQDDE
ncbi:MAG: flagellar filament capping protein FliD [Pseudomonadota bacterium]